MVSSGNGNVRRCVQNLLRTFRGENPYERVKGIDPRLIDKPIIEAEPQARQDAEWLIDTYEPRATINGITVSSEDAVGGGFVINADIAGRE